MKLLVFVALSLALLACVQEQQLPNPASQHCVDLGGTLTIITAEDGSQSGLCTLPDGTECDEWALYRGECS